MASGPSASPNVRRRLTAAASLRLANKHCSASEQSASGDFVPSGSERDFSPFHLESAA